MNHEALERIELKIAFLECANNDLSDVVYRQQREIESMRLQLTALESRLETLKSQELLEPEQERPPHY